MTQPHDVIKRFPKTIAIDFDGVIHHYRKGWHDGSVYDGPFPSAKESIQELLDQGHRILIYSTRLTDRIIDGKIQPNQLDEIKAWWKKHQLPEDVTFWVGPGKPLAFVYIDDRALHHISWPLTMSMLSSLIQVQKG